MNSWSRFRPHMPSTPAPSTDVWIISYGSLMSGLGLQPLGKAVFPAVGELSISIVRAAVARHEATVLGPPAAAGTAAPAPSPARIIATAARRGPSTRRAPCRARAPRIAASVGRPAVSIARQVARPSGARHAGPGRHGGAGEGATPALPRG